MLMQAVREPLIVGRDLALLQQGGYAGDLQHQPALLQVEGPARLRPGRRQSGEKVDPSRLKGQAQVQEVGHVRRVAVGLVSRRVQVPHKHGCDRPCPIGVGQRRPVGLHGELSNGLAHLREDAIRVPVAHRPVPHNVPEVRQLCHHGVAPDARIERLVQILLDGTECRPQRVTNIGFQFAQLETHVARRSGPRRTSWVLVR